MNRNEHLLVILMEECTELAHAASKALRFGPGSDYDGITNREKLLREYNDILAVVEMLNDDGVGDMYEDADLIEAKKKKIARFLRDSKRIGTLVE